MPKQQIYFVIERNAVIALRKIIVQRLLYQGKNYSSRLLILIPVNTHITALSGQNFDIQILRRKNNPLFLSLGQFLIGDEQVVDFKFFFGQPHLK